jgi:hypothetical protein
LLRRGARKVREATVNTNETRHFDRSGFIVLLGALALGCEAADPGALDGAGGEVEALEDGG